MNKQLYIYLLFCCIITIIFYVFFYCVMNTGIESIQKTNINYDLNRDGCCVFHNVLSKDEIYNLKDKCQQNNYKYIKDYLINNTKLNNLIHNSTSNDYMFQDYIWIIKKSSVHTCHRDNNGDFFNV